MLNLFKQIIKIKYKFLYIYLSFFLLFISLFSFLFLHQSTKSENIELKVIDGKNSIVWQQATNRYHLQKSILLYCLNKL